MFLAYPKDCLDIFMKIQIFLPVATILLVSIYSSLCLVSSCWKSHTLVGARKACHYRDSIATLLASQLWISLAKMDKSEVKGGEAEADIPHDKRRAAAVEIPWKSTPWLQAAVQMWTEKHRLQPSISVAKDWFYQKKSRNNSSWS